MKKSFKDSDIGRKIFGLELTSEDVICLKNPVGNKDNELQGVYISFYTELQKEGKEKILDRTRILDEFESGRKVTTPAFLSLLDEKAVFLEVKSKVFENGEVLMDITVDALADKCYGMSGVVEDYRLSDNEMKMMVEKVSEYESSPLAKNLFKLAEDAEKKYEMDILNRKKAKSWRQYLRKDRI